MQSSLANQLNQMGNSKSLQRNFDKNATVSLLFDFKTAANFDFDTLYQIAINGFEQMQAENSNYTQFYNQFFDSSLKQYAREKLTKSENEAFSKKVKKFLLLLSTDFLNECVQQIMEYMLRNFDVHLYESEQLILNFMPYHSTPVYTKLLQNIELKNLNHFFFLDETIKRGIYIRRNLICGQIFHDIWILESLIRQYNGITSFFCKSQQTSDIVFSSKIKRSVQQSQPHKQILNFLTAIMVDILNSKKITDSMMQRIMDFCLQRLSEGEDEKVSSLMIFGQIFTHQQQLKNEVLEAIFLDINIQLSNNFSQGNLTICKKLLQFLVYMIQAKVIKNFPAEACKTFIQHSDKIASILQDLSKEASFCNFYVQMYQSMLTQKQDVTLFEKVLEFILQNDVYLGQIKPLYNAFVDYLLDIYFQDYFGSNLYNQNMAKVVLMFKKNFLSQTTQYLQSKYQEEDQKFSEKIKKVVKTTYDEGFYEIFVGENSVKKPLKESLQDANPNVKMQALQNVLNKTNINREYADYISEIVIDHLQSEKNLKVLEKMFQVLSQKELLKHLNAQQMRNISFAIIRKLLADRSLILKQVDHIFMELTKRAQKFQDNSLTANVLGIHIILQKDTKEIQGLVDLSTDQLFSHLTLLIQQTPQIFTHVQIFLDIIYSNTNQDQIMTFLNQHKTQYNHSQNNSSLLNKLLKNKNLVQKNIFLFETNDLEVLKLFKQNVLDQLVQQDQCIFLIQMIFQNSNTKIISKISFFLQEVLQTSSKDNLIEIGFLIILISLFKQNYENFKDISLIINLLKCCVQTATQMQLQKQDTNKIHSLQYYLENKKKTSFLLEWSFKDLKKLSDVVLEFRHEIKHNNSKLSEVVKKNVKSFEAFKKLFEYLFENIHFQSQNFEFLSSYIECYDAIFKKDSTVQNCLKMQQLLVQKFDSSLFEKYLQIFNLNNVKFIVENYSEFVLKFSDKINDDRKDNILFDKCFSRQGVFELLDAPSQIDILTRSLQLSLNQNEQIIPILQQFQISDENCKLLLQNPRADMKARILLLLDNKVRVKITEDIFQSLQLHFTTDDEEITPYNLIAHHLKLISENGHSSESNITYLQQLAQKIHQSNLEFFGHPLKCECIYLIVQIICNQVKSLPKKVTQKCLYILKQMHKQADGNQKYLNSLFNLTSFCVQKIKAQSKVNLNKFILFHVKVFRDTFRFQQNFQDKSNQVLENLFQSLVSIYGQKNTYLIVLSMIRVTYGSVMTKEKNDTFDKLTGVIISAFFVNDDLKNPINSLDKILDFFIQTFTGNKNQYGFISNSLDFGKQSCLKFMIRSFLLVLQKVISCQKFQKLLELEFSKFEDQSQVISIISKFYAQIFRFQISLSKSNKNFTKVFIKKVRVQLKNISEYLLNMPPFEFLVLITLEIIDKKSHGDAVKTKILQFMSEKLQQKSINLRKQALDNLKLLTKVILRDLDNLQAQGSKDEDIYIQNSIILLTMIAHRKPQIFEEYGISSVMKYLQSENGIVKNGVVFLISALSQTLPDQFLENINEIFMTIYKSFKLIQKELASDDRKQKKQGNQSALLMFKSIISIVKNIKNMINPYLDHIMETLFLWENSDITLDTKIQDIITAIGSNIDIRNLVLPMKNNIQRCKQNSSVSVQRMTFLLKSVSTTMTEEQFENNHNEIFKLFLAIFDYTRENFLNQETLHKNQKLVDRIDDQVVEAFGQFVLKTNKISLRKIFLQFINWSDHRFDEQNSGYQFNIYRKLIVFKTMVYLSSLMTSLFVPFNTYIFEHSVNMIQDFTQKAIIPPITKNGKRIFQHADCYYKLENKLVRLIIQNFQLCFQFDKEEFIDTSRFEKLAGCMPDLFDSIHQPHFEYQDFIDSRLIPGLLSLVNLVDDDYKWKTIHYNILVKLRTDQIQIKTAVLKYMQKLIDSLKERYIVLINDFLPFLAETLDDPDSEVEQVSKALVIQLESISGENIREILKNN